MSEAHPQYIGTVEVCKMLGIDRSTLTRWVQASKLKPAMRLPGPNGVMLFDPADVQNLMDRAALANPPAEPTT